MASSTKTAGAVLKIDLAALKSNYKFLAKKAGRAETACAIKGDAYGVGIAAASKTLWQAGARSFYVARPEEGAELRKLLPKATITVLDGLYKGESKFYHAHKLLPALTTFEQSLEWEKFGGGAPCVLHFDTGINRVGLNVADFTKIITQTNLNVAVLMSHLACADDVDSPMNHEQWMRFKAIRMAYPDAKASFANSSGIFLGKSYHFDQVRPGIALYGGNPVPLKKNPMKPVAHLSARILQVRDVAKGETVGYSATWKAQRISKIAIIAAGYADGIARKLSSSQQNGPAQVAIGGIRCPIIGRVSMDMMTIDVTELAPRKLNVATHAELFGKDILIDEAASWAGTISYELLTHLGKRYARVY